MQRHPQVDAGTLLFHLSFVQLKSHSTRFKGIVYRSLHPCSKHSRETHYERYSDFTIQMNLNFSSGASANNFNGNYLLGTNEFNLLRRASAFCPAWGKHSVGNVLMKPLEQIAKLKDAQVTTETSDSSCSQWSSGLFREFWLHRHTKTRQRAFAHQVNVAIACRSILNETEPVV